MLILIVWTCWGFLYIMGEPLEEAKDSQPILLASPIPATMPIRSCEQVTAPLWEAYGARLNKETIGKFDRGTTLTPKGQRVPLKEIARNLTLL